MRLFDIADEIERTLAAGADPETGEITEETLTTLDALEGERDAKALDVAAYLKGEIAEAIAVEHIIEGLERRAQTHRNRAESLRGYLQKFCERDAKLEDARSVISWRKSTAVEIVAEAMIPARWFRDPDPPVATPDKKRIGVELKAGRVVPGARLDRRTKLGVK